MKKGLDFMKEIIYDYIDLYMRHNCNRQEANRYRLQQR